MSKGLPGTNPVWTSLVGAPVICCNALLGSKDMMDDRAVKKKQRTNNEQQGRRRRRVSTDRSREKGERTHESGLGVCGGCMVHLPMMRRERKEERDKRKQEKERGKEEEEGEDEGGGGRRETRE